MTDNRRSDLHPGLTEEERRAVLRERIRNAPKTVKEAGGVVPVEAVLAVLRGDGAHHRSEHGDRSNPPD